MTNTAAQFNTSQHRLKFGSCGLSIYSFISLFTLIFCRCSFFSLNCPKVRWIGHSLFFSCNMIFLSCVSAASRPLCAEISRSPHDPHWDKWVSKWMVITVYLSIAYIAHLTLIELMYCSDGETRWWWRLKGASHSSHHDCWCYRYASLGHKWWWRKRGRQRANTAKLWLNWWIKRTFNKRYEHFFLFHEDKRLLCWTDILNLLLLTKKSTY